MEATVFNQAQMQLLDMMSFVKTSEGLDRLNKALSDYFVRQAQEEIDHLWETGELNEEKVESFRHLHERTPYKQIYPVMQHIVLDTNSLIMAISARSVYHKVWKAFIDG